jgi:hypothetical protein
MEATANSPQAVQHLLQSAYVIMSWIAETVMIPILKNLQQSRRFRIRACDVWERQPNHIQRRLLLTRCQLQVLAPQTSNP